MKFIYKQIKSDKGNIYFGVKIFLSIFILSLWFIDSNWFSGESNVLIAASLIVSLITTMFYGIIFIHFYSFSYHLPVC